MRLFDFLKPKKVFIHPAPVGRFKIGRWVTYHDKIGIVADHAGDYCVVHLVDTRGENILGGVIVVPHLALREAYVEEVPHARASAIQVALKGYRHAP